MLSETLAMFGIEASAKKRRVCGMDIVVQVEEGQVRRGTDKSGKPWSTRLPYAYGFIPGTKGMDGDCVDCYVGRSLRSDRVFVVHMPQDFGDEDKAMIGFASKEAAKKAFLSCYGYDGRFLGAISSMSVEDFKRQLKENRGRRIQAVQDPSIFSWESFDAVPPKNTVPVGNPGSAEDLAYHDAAQVAFEKELMRRNGAKTVATVSQGPDRAIVDPEVWNHFQW